MNITAVGVDLSKNFYMVHAVNERGGKEYRATVSRDKFLAEVSLKSPTATVYMEACGGAHYLCWELEKRGITAKQIDTREVKKHCSHQKNDYRDAEGIVKAGTREDARFVSTKSKEQVDLQVQIRIRERLVKNQTALMNEIRGFLLEQGIVIKKSKAALQKYLSDDYHREERFSHSFRLSIDSLVEELGELQLKIKALNLRLAVSAKASPTVKSLTSLPGVGVLTALCLVAAHGDASQYKNGRHLAAAIGLVPRQFTTGGVPRLGRITKHGNKYLRVLLIHGARACLGAALKKKVADKHSTWITKLYEKKGYNLTSVAIANKNARIAYRMLRDPSVRFDSDTAHGETRNSQQLTATEVH